MNVFGLRLFCCARPARAWSVARAGAVCSAALLFGARGAAAGPPETTQPAAEGAPVNRWLVGGHVLGTSLVTRSVALGVGLSGELALHRGGVWSPRVRATFLSSEDDELKNLPVDGANVSLFALRLEGCPLALEAPRRVVLSPCVGVEVGWLRVKSGTLYIEANNRLWLAPTAAGRVQWFPPLGKTSFDRRLALELQGGAFVPLVDRDLVFDATRALVRSVPSVGGFVSLGVGAGF